MKNIFFNYFKSIPLLLPLNIFLTVVYPTITLANSLQNNQICKAVNNENSLVTGRSKTITFPNGRTITVVGHIHGTRQINQIYDLIINGQLDKMTDQDFDALLMKISDKNSKSNELPWSLQYKNSVVKYFKNKYGINVSKIVHTTISYNLKSTSVESHAIDDFKFLSYLLADSNSQIKFIGYEGSQETWVHNFPTYILARQELLKQFFRRKESGKLQFTLYQLENLILSASNGNVYTYMVNPNLNLSIPMIGTEDESVFIKYKNVDTIEDMSKAYQEIIEADKLYWKEKSITEKQAFNSIEANRFFIELLTYAFNEVLSMRISTYNELDKIIDYIKINSPKWIQPLLEKLFVAMKLRLQINIERDTASAINLASRNETGVHFVGLNHLYNTVSILENICHQELKHFYNSTNMNSVDSK